MTGSGRSALCRVGQATKYFIVLATEGFAKLIPIPFTSAPLATNGPTNGPPDARFQKCRIPECPYNAFFDVSAQEQTEYCGQRHELWVYFDFYR
jgi:hypothetical protein